MIKPKRKNLRDPDSKKITLFTPVCAILLSLFGIAAVYSAARDLGTSYTTKQIFAVFLGICFMFIISYINYEYLLDTRLCIAFLAISVIMLCLTLVIGTGESAKNWIRLVGLSIYIQPSEFVKFLFILTFSKHIDLVKTKINKITSVLSLLVHALLIVGLVILQDDLGSALVFIFMALCMCYGAGLSYIYLLSGVALTVIASPYVWDHLRYYQQQRILVGFDPESDPLGKGYQQVLSKKAMANGGFFGTGYMKGQVSPDIPYKHTDMIFSVISEELGMIGAIILFTLLIILTVSIVATAFRSRKDAGATICLGVAAMIMAQTLENIGMSLGLLPIVGITLPFISYGGSSVLSMFISIGLVLSVSRYRNKYYFEREQR